MTNVLFVCGRNRWRSPTAEQIFSALPEIETASAGTSKDADTPLSDELIAWSDIIFVMETAQRQKLTTQFRAAVKGKRIVCLDIPDRFCFMDPELVTLLTTRVTPHLR